MIFYEVTVDVQASIAESYLEWLLEHVREMETFPGFGTAQVYEEQTAPDSIMRWVIIYPVHSATELEDYFQNEAPRMREDGLNRFSDQFTASRRILKPKMR